MIFTDDNSQKMAHNVSEEKRIYIFKYNDFNYTENIHHLKTKIEKIYTKMKRDCV